MPPTDEIGPSEPWPPRRGAPPPAVEPQTESYRPMGRQGGEAAPLQAARIPARDDAPEVAPPPPEDQVPDDAVPCQGAQTVGGVGPNAILASDVWIAADSLLARLKDKIPPEAVEAQREILIKQNFRQLLKQQVETKLVYYDARKALPDEAIKNVEQQLNRIFEETELPKLMELWGVKSQRELDQKLIGMGMSVNRHKRAFLEEAISQQWIRQQIKIDEDVNHDQLLTYYEQNISEFEQPGRARWEQLMVRISRYPSEEAARAALAQMGNRVMDGQPLAEVARQFSDGPTASQGGLRNWTTRGSLVSEALDRAIFGLPIGQLSPILEDNHALHIVRVVERVDAHRTPFVDAQVEIREKIRQQRNRVQQQAYLDRLRRRVPTWTLYDDKSGGGGLLDQDR